MKIGQVSGLLGLSPETIRYYEHEDILSPVRKEDSKYREYSAWDIFDLIECMMYRGMNFSVKEIQQIGKDSNIDLLTYFFATKKNELAQKIEYDHYLLECIEHRKTKIDTASFNIGNYWVAKEPELKCITCTTRNGFEFTDFDYQNPVLATWLQAAPFGRILFFVQPEGIEIEDKNLCSFAIESKYANFLNLPIDHQIFTVPEKYYLHTVIRLKEKGELFLAAIKDALAYAESRKLKIDGNVICELLTRVYNHGGWYGYIEIMIPIVK